MPFLLLPCLSLLPLKPGVPAIPDVSPHCLSSLPWKPGVPAIPVLSGNCLSLLPLNPVVSRIPVTSPNCLSLLPPSTRFKFSDLMPFLFSPNPKSRNTYSCLPVYSPIGDFRIATGLTGSSSPPFINSFNPSRFSLVKTLDIMLAIFSDMLNSGASPGIVGSLLLPAISPVAASAPYLNVLAQAYLSVV